MNRSSNLPVIFLLTAAVVISATAVSVLAQQGPVPEGSVAKWTVRGTRAGTPVRLRVRSQVMEYVLGGGGWQIEGPAGVVPARLVLPPDPPEPVVSDLPLFTTANDGGDLLIDFDRGEDLFAINRLELRLASGNVLCLARVAASAGGAEYRRISENQLLCQRISAGQLARFTTLGFNETSDRYLRVRLVGEASSPLDSASCWYEQEYGYPSYKINAALGPMAEGAVPGESVWPLLLQGDNQPLLKLKVLSASTGEIRAMRLVRNAAGSGEPLAEYSAFWADGISHGGLALSEKWIRPGQLGYGNGWSLVVDDAGQSILPLSGIEAYAAEVFVELRIPDGSAAEGELPAPLELTLWQSAAAEQPAEPDFDGSPELKLVGEFISWSVSRPLELPPEPRPVLGGLLDDLWWVRPAVYAAAALLLLLLGMVLLRRPRELR